MAVDEAGCVTDGLPTAGEVASAVGVGLDRASQLAQVADELVTGYAPGAPAAVRYEAGLRVAGYLADRPAGHRRTRTQIGDYEREVMYEPTTSALRASGAMGLLSRWRKRRAGVIG